MYRKLELLQLFYLWIIFSSFLLNPFWLTPRAWAHQPCKSSVGLCVTRSIYPSGFRMWATLLIAALNLYYVMACCSARSGQRHYYYRISTVACGSHACSSPCWLTLQQPCALLAHKGRFFLHREGPGCRPTLRITRVSISGHNSSWWSAI
jgi:hypothetical protein